MNGPGGGMGGPMGGPAGGMQRVVIGPRPGGSGPGQGSGLAAAAGGGGGGGAPGAVGGPNNFFTELIANLAGAGMEGGHIRINPGEGLFQV